MATAITNSAPQFSLLSQQRRTHLDTETKAPEPLHADGDGDDVGVPVDDESPVAMLFKFTEATDEMSAAMAQFRNRREYDKTKGASDDSSFERVLDEEVQEKAVFILKAVSANQSGDINLLLQQLRFLFPDDSDLYQVLRELLNKKELDEIGKKRLEELLDLVEKQADPRRLKAGINVALKARLFGKSLNLSPGLLRESYRNFLESENHCLMTYQDWVITYGSEYRAAVTQFIEEALVSDIDALDPSCSHREFGGLLQRMGDVKRLRSSEEIFIKGLLTNAGIQQLNPREEAWLFLMLDMLQDATRFSSAFENVCGEETCAKTLSGALQQVNFWSKKLPAELFPDPLQKSILEQELISNLDKLWALELRTIRAETDSSR